MTGEFAKFLPSVYEATRAIREGRGDLPEVRYPRHSWPANDAPDYVWQAARMWHRGVSRFLDRSIDDDFRRQTAEEFPPPKDRLFLGWWADVLNDKMLRESGDILRVMLLSAAFYKDDAQGIATGMADVLGNAGKGTTGWARMEATWRGIRAARGSATRGQPKDDLIGYLRAWVAKDASSCANRYGAERPNDPIRLREHERIPAGLIERPIKHRSELQRSESLFAEDLERMTVPSHEVLRLLSDERKENKRVLNAISECLDVGHAELLDLISDGVPAAEAERRLGAPDGTWRNLRKRVHRKIPKLPK